MRGNRPRIELPSTITLLSCHTLIDYVTARRGEEHTEAVYEIAERTGKYYAPTRGRGLCTSSPIRQPEQMEYAAQTRHPHTHIHTYLRAWMI